MSTPKFWLASYPRSGNTFLRTIIFHCFGVRTASIYPGDISGAVAEMVGHIEHKARGVIDYGDEPVRILKTHKFAQDDGWPAIYILRDGRDAVASLYDLYKGEASLRQLIEGKTVFGTWSDHVTKWAPLDRRACLFLKYEQISADIPGTICRLAEFIGIPPIGTDVPSRDELARKDGLWIRSAATARTELTGPDLDLFMRINGEAMKKYGYADR